MTRRKIDNGCVNGAVRVRTVIVRTVLAANGGIGDIGTRDSGLGSDCFYSRGAFLGGRRLLPDVPMSRVPSPA